MKRKTFQSLYWLRLLFFSFFLKHRGGGAVGKTVGPASGRLWHRASVYNGNLRELMTLTPVNIWTVTPVFMIYVYRGWSSNTQPPECEVNALTMALPPRYMNSIRMVQISLMRSGWNDAIVKKKKQTHRRLIIHLIKRFNLRE